MPPHLGYVWIILTSLFSDRSLMVLVPSGRVTWGGEVQPQNEQRTRNARWESKTVGPNLLLDPTISTCRGQERLLQQEWSRAVVK